MKQLFIFIASITRTSFQKSYISNSFLERAILKVILQILHCINSKWTLKEIICWVPHNHTLVCKPPQPVGAPSRSPHTFWVPVQVTEELSLLTTKQLSCVRRLEQSSRALRSFSTLSLSMNFVYHRTLYTLQFPHLTL